MGSYNIKKSNRQRGEYVENGISRRVTNNMKSRKANSMEKLFRIFTGIAITFLSIYIVFHCINIITLNSAREKVVTAANAASKILVNEIVSNSSTLAQYMLYIENHDSLPEEVKKQFLSSAVTDYIKSSEYSYDTTDPGYEQVVELIYASINTKPKEEVTTAKAEPAAEKVVKTSNVIVPIPKVNGTLYTAKNLKSFKNTVNKFYTITSATSMKESDLPLSKAINEKFKVSGNGKKPQILIYHTHSQESFTNSNSDKGTTIIGVGDQLTRILSEQFGYNVIHDKTSYDIVDGVLDRSAAYDQAREGVATILKKYPSISLVLDIHRDGVNENTRLVTKVNNKTTAQVMFFNGMSRFKESGNIEYLYNKYLYENLALSLQMKLACEAYYPGFARRNYVNAYKYNLDLCRQCMLIEVGAQTNNYQEAINAAEPLAVIIDKVMK